MQFSYNWLQEFFDDKLPDPVEVATQLGLHAFELEGIDNLDNGDVLIDWDVLPNRSSDCLCYEGIAQEISAVFQIPCKSYLDGLEDKEYSVDIKSSEKIDFSLNTDMVNRATKRYATEVTIKPSPKWLQDKLESIGQNSINNVVDITNYVMWMTGQPVHAFDYDKLSGQGKKSLQIRHAQNGERVTDLTGVEHELDESMLVVADNDKALDIAGIKGGNNSGVEESSKNIVLSACNYDYQNIRYTSRKLKLQTDASKRYENEVPLCKADRAMRLLAHLMVTEADAVVSNDIIDTHPENEPIRTVSLSVQHTNSLLGTNIEQSEIVSVLERIKIVCSVGESEGDLIATIPAERLDLNIAEDIIEEVGRLHGLHNIPETPISEGFNTPERNMIKQSWYKTGDALTQIGFYEAYNRSLVKEGVVKLANSLNENADSLRLSLLPLLQEKTERNFVHTDTPHFFEIGKVFTGVTDGTVDEHWSFAGVLGRRKIKDKHKNDLFLETKGVVETVFETLHVQGVEWKEGAGDTIAILEVDGDVLGSVGVNWWEINFDELVNLIDKTVDYTKPSKYPKMDRDVAVWVPMETRVQDVRDIIESAGHEKCIDTQLFDVFEDSENDRKSVGFRLVFQCHTQTLSDDYANNEMDKVYQSLKNQPGFEIR